MASGERAFAQKLNKQPNADVRRTVSGTRDLAKGGSTNSPHAVVPLCDVVDPVKFEDFIEQYHDLSDSDPIIHLLEFPPDDLEVGFVPRRCRTLLPIVPETEAKLMPFVRDCLKCLTSDWLVISRKYLHYSTSSCQRDRGFEKMLTLKSAPKHEYEIDLEVKEERSPGGLRNGHPPLAEDEDTSDSSAPASARHSVHGLDEQITPRGSWASSMFDLHNSQPDSLLPTLLDARAEPSARHPPRQDSVSLFALYPPQEEEEFIERRQPPPLPKEHLGHRILVKCLSLKLELEIEPIFGIMAVYDAKERKKVSENFYFDLNPEPLKRMLSSHVLYQDISTLSRSAIFSISHPSPDLFLVIKLEKVLQGDITECAEPYIKDDKSRSDKIRANAAMSCERLGKFRMPFAWTAIHLQNIFNGVTEQLADGSGAGSSNSLERKASNTLESLRKKGGDSLSRKSSLERDSKLQQSDEGALENFRPVTLTVNSFFKQEGDRLRDEDLYKYLVDLKRPSSLLKRLKCIPGHLKLDISPCPEEVKHCLSPELAQLRPQSTEGRPTREILEFPSKEVYCPHYVYRNLLYVCPRNLNFANRPGSARNITCKVQFMNGEEEPAEAIFGRSSCPEFTKEYYTAVTYHNKCPDFYDEIKVKLPAQLSEKHHLLFTFYHISCQKKPELQTPTETPIGYTWLPLYQDGKLQTGEFSLPVMMDPPPPSYNFLTPSIQIPNTRWVDNHKGVFTVNVDLVSSVFPKDPHIEQLLYLSSLIEEGTLPPRMKEGGVLEPKFKSAILGLSKAEPESLVHFLPVVLNKLFQLVVQTPGQPQLNVSQAAFETLASLVNTLTNLLESHNDHYGRNSLLATYVQYQACLPQPAEFCLPMPPHSGLTGGSVTPDLSSYTSTRPFPAPLQRSYRSSSNPDIPSHPGRGLDRTASLRQPELVPVKPSSASRRVVHEELALQWVVASGRARELALTHAWFFFEIMIRSMVEHLAVTARLDLPRKERFPPQFADDITNLVTSITSDIISRYNREVKDVRTIQRLNTSLAFFLFDLLSVADRGLVLSLVRSYCKQMGGGASLPEAGHQLAAFKLDLLRILCSHEHFVTLNLPFRTPLSRSFTELSPDYRHQHFLLGLVLCDLAVVMDINNPSVQLRAINLVRNLLTSHDWDPRFAEPEHKSRVAALYLPLLGIVTDCLSQLCPPANHCHDGINHTIAMAIAGADLCYRNTRATAFDPYQQNRKCQLKESATRHLLASFLWVLKHTDEKVLRQWWSETPPLRLQQLLDVLFVCVSCFEYKGKHFLRSATQQSLRKTLDIKSRLEDAILGHSSARSEMMLRHKGERFPPSPHQSGDKLRWRKEMVAWRTTSADSTDGGRPWNKTDLEAEAYVEGALSAEVTLIVLQTLELIVQVACQSDPLQVLLSSVLRVLLHALGSSQSSAVLQALFSTQRSLVTKFPELLFEEETEQCADLCLRLLRHCSSSISSVRSQASASLYLLMRQNFEIGNNFARVKMQVTMSLSSLVGTSQNFSEGYLRRSLKTILIYAEEDKELQETSFPEQVKDLVFNLHMILSDTVKMKEFQEDPEMLLDLMYRIAKGYQNSPDLRLTWLANMAQKHTERGNHTEAALCLVHSAALVAEYLHMLEDKPYLPVGCVTFDKVTSNILEESAVSDDILSPDEEGVCTGKYFSEAGLVGLLEQGANSFNLAGMYEAMNQLYKILIPIAEANRDYKKLANIHAKLHEAFTKIDQQAGKRVFGTYFRVGFYGHKFGDLDNEEFVYKEPTLTKLPEISHRLENFYLERFGSEYVEMIKDSNSVDPSKLHPEKAYIQITYVEPYFDMYELRERRDIFQKNYNIRRFIYATPFTPDGRAHGELQDQYKRKTILTTVNSFPYVKTRIQVVEKQQVVLSPIEVAIEDIQKKTAELASATTQEPADPKILQMVLQGCIGTTVNQGPVEVAVVFLSDLMDGSRSPSPLQNKLRLCFKDFSAKCSTALKKNRTLIGPEQKDYQKELERNYQRFTERLQPMIRNKGTQLGHKAVRRDGVMSTTEHPRSKRTSPVV